MASLFDPFTLNGLILPNRIVMAPMTRYFSPGGIPGPDVAAYYRRRAEGECGLIITEGTTVRSPVAGGYQKVPEFWGEALGGWKRVVDEVHGAGGLIMPQLWHVGLQRNPALSPPNPELAGHGPSGLNTKFETVAPPMTEAEIRDTVTAFAESAAHARALGFDGVELHGAHGYLIDQFFWERTNLREDEFGGDIERRTRFAVELGQAIRREVGDDYPLILRMSQWKSHDYGAKLAPDPATLKLYLDPLVAAGIDAFHCSQRRFWEPEFEGSDLNLAGWVKQLTGKPTITVGSVGLSGEFLASLHRGEGAEVSGIDDLLARLARDEFDLVAVGRALISNPDWVKLVRLGRLEALAAYKSADLQTLY